MKTLEGWADGQARRVEWRHGESVGWRRRDGGRVICGPGDVVTQEEGSEGFEANWAWGWSKVIPGHDEADGANPDTLCANWSSGCNGVTDGSRWGRLTLCDDCEDEKRLDWAGFVGDGVKRPATRHEVEVLEAEAARLFRCGCNDVQVGQVARMGELVVGEIKRPDGLPCGLIAAEW